MIHSTLSFIKNKCFPFLQILLYNTIFKGWIELLGTKDKRILKWNISLCLIFKNEAPFLKEWLDYHLVVGIDHFYLYNNESDDNYLEILEPYIKQGIVTLIEWPGACQQFVVYKHCYEIYRNETKWLSFLDADEFFVPKYVDTIEQWMKPFEKYPAIMIQWLMFGTGGSLNHDYNKYVIRQYFSCWNTLHPFGKCLINTRFDISDFDSWHVHHHVYVKYNIFGFRVSLPAVNQFGYICPVGHSCGCGKNQIEKSSIFINHYYTKSWDLLYKKITKTDVLRGSLDLNYRLEKFYQQEMKCINTNHVIQRYYIKLVQFQNKIKIKSND